MLVRAPQPMRVTWQIGGEVAMAVRRWPTLANHSARCASFVHCKIDGNKIRVLTYIGQIAYLIGMRRYSDQPNIEYVQVQSEY